METMQITEKGKRVIEESLKMFSDGKSTEEIAEHFGLDLTALRVLLGIDMLADDDGKIELEE